MELRPRTAEWIAMPDKVRQRLQPSQHVADAVAAVQMRERITVQADAVLDELGHRRRARRGRVPMVRDCLRWPRLDEREESDLLPGCAKLLGDFPGNDSA